ncbi:BlaI/MecI/CopY family transcriptional regulator [Paucibacter sp. TC2R-5]|uniref:BlaI/MecI/CopY family transcriptional regulator n=1 Tax=Paucibacter sp. TC2R-5 TaxID=2893555 RepID=UPI0021E4D5E0|nr:BlaI/MecI/CopY family transcriptional regulator [Paucibacter sp. TC2R-5]MCV2360997.1 BlaI/MecI/CopY family transcriptional regulator [Paucibacter sp. TC2R-5]
MSPISEAESRILQVLWQRQAQTAEDIAAALAQSLASGAAEWQLGTVKTLLNRLLNKGAVSAEREGRRYLYSPVLAQQAWEEEETLGLLDRLFLGRLSPLVAHFSAQRRLSAEDVLALRQLLDQQAGGTDDDGQS